MDNALDIGSSSTFRSYMKHSSPESGNNSKQVLAPEVEIHAVDLEHAHPQVRPEIKSSWFSKLSQRIAVHHPGLHRSIQRALLYLRGPRPKVDLPPPRPLFDIDRTLGRYKIVFLVESTLIKVTQPLSAPWVFWTLVVAYIIGSAFFSRAQSFVTSSESYISCTSTYWLANNQCGQDGVLCGPYDTDPFDFRCPAQCDRVILQNPRTIGDTQMAFVPLIVGGGDPNGTYRGDSSICNAAIQAGVITSKQGGCGTVQVVGNFTNFLPLTAHGLRSIGFPTNFPIAFRFGKENAVGSCTDMRDGALALNILISCVLFLFLRPKPIVLFWCLVCIGFWHVTLFSQPRGPPPDLERGFGAFLPTLFVGYGFWRVAFRFVLPIFLQAAPLESCLLYLSGFWVGVLNNLTFDRLPLSRLTSSDLNKRAGALATFVVLLVVVIVGGINQARVIRKTGWLPYYASWYVAGAAVILILANLPGLSLRLHHYILPMLLIPATAFPTRLSAILQGILLGLFLNGVAAFGYDSIVQTPAALRQDATLGSDMPVWLTNSANFNASVPYANQTIHWGELPLEGWDAFSLLVDDVQRYVGTALNYSLAQLDTSLPHFFRLAYLSNGQPSDFTMAATLWPNGTWVDPLPGASY